MDTELYECIKAACNPVIHSIKKKPTKLNYIDQYYYNQIYSFRNNCKKIEELRIRKDSTKPEYIDYDEYDQYYEYNNEYNEIVKEYNYYFTKYDESSGSDSD